MSDRDIIDEAARQFAARLELSRAVVADLHARGRISDEVADLLYAALDVDAGTVFP